jgi:hypothetical protein
MFSTDLFFFLPVALTPSYILVFKNSFYPWLSGSAGIEPVDTEGPLYFLLLVSLVDELGHGSRCRNPDPHDSLFTQGLGLVVIFFFFLEMGSCYVAQAGLELLGLKSSFCLVLQSTRRLWPGWWL